MSKHIKELQVKIHNAIEKKEYILASEFITNYKNNYGVNDEISNMEAIIDYCSGNYKSALSCIKAGLKYNIANSNLYYNMAAIYEALDKNNKAYLCYENALHFCFDNEARKQIYESMEALKLTGTVTAKKVSIIILTHNNFEFTKLCINSIRKHNSSDTYEIIVVDNNSTDETVNFLKEQEDIITIYNNKNEGFPKGCNIGIEAASKDTDILLLNNDTVILDNSIFNLRMALYSNDHIGAVGAVSNNVSNYQMISEKYENLADYVKYAQLNNIPDTLRHEARLKLVGFGMLINRTVLDKVGLLDTRFSPGNFEDDDLSFRIIKSGFKNVLCKDSFIFHFGSMSFRKDHNQLKKIIEINNQKFIDKWGFSTYYSTNIRFDVISQITHDKNEKIRILEVGCACGATLLQIKNVYKNAEIYGIELNEKCARIAKCFCDVRFDNIENINLSYEEEYFDYIIFADVLEHLYDPSLVIRNIKKYLKKDGTIIASIPNVMHYSVVEGLLNGEWEYKDSGILDRTHLRFFTFKEIKKMFEAEKYKVTSIASNNIGITKSGQELIDGISKIFKDINKQELMAYQYIVNAKKI